MTRIPAGTTHVLTNVKHEGDAEFIQLSEDLGKSREWYKGPAIVFSKWVYIPSSLIDLDCYTPIGEFSNAKVN